MLLRGGVDLLFYPAPGSSAVTHHLSTPKASLGCLARIFKFVQGDHVKDAGEIRSGLDPLGPLPTELIVVNLGRRLEMLGQAIETMVRSFGRIRFAPAPILRAEIMMKFPKHG